MSATVLSMEDARFFSDCAEVLRLFDAQTPIRLLEAGGEIKDGEALVIQRSRRLEGRVEHFARCAINGREAEYSHALDTPADADALLYKKLFKRGLKTAVYRALRECYSSTPPWGSLTGIRPTKLVYDKLSKGETKEYAAAVLRDTYDLRADKIGLLMDIIDAQAGIRMPHPQKFVDVYIGIAFCPGRCGYCAFPSVDVNKNKKLIEPYVRALQYEIERTRTLIDALGYSARALYVGGGTPTAIGIDPLESVLEQARSAFPAVCEMTVEAGRPDTLSGEMLHMLSRFGPPRLSINPQSMNGRTLERIGRLHDPRSIERAFEAARRYGFVNINADIIMGLPGEDVRDAARTLARVLALWPESLTVHTLALKRASRFKAGEGGFEPVAASEVEAMIELARGQAAAAGMRPYYLYRQKYMTGNLENVGYAIKGRECVYNIDVMEETHSVLALGTGAVTKRYFPNENRLERFANPRSVEQYIQRVQEMCDKREAFFARETSGFTAESI